MKKTLGLLLALAMLLSLLPAAALAEEIRIVDVPEEELIQIVAGEETAPAEEPRAEFQKLPGASPEADNPVSYRALLVGEVHFSWETATRNEGDVKLIKEMLNNVEGPEGGTYSVSCQYDLGNNGIKNAISSAFAGADDNDVSLFFIATHGVVDVASGPYAGELVTIYSPGEYDDYLTLGDLASWLKAVPGKVIVVLGSCGSGAAIVNNGTLRFAGDEETDALFTESVIRTFAEQDAIWAAERGAQPDTGEFRSSKFYVLTAAAHQESSWGSEYYHYNFFPYYFAKGANTGMPADANNDETVTLQEMFEYCYENAYGPYYDGYDNYYQHAQVYPENSSYPLFAAGEGPEPPEGAVAYGQCGDNLTWALDGDGVLTVSGTGVMWDFWSSTPEWDDYLSEIRKVVVEEGVTSIGVNAFWDACNLTEVSLPQSLDTIESYAFDACDLEAITIPKNVSYIDWGAFRLNHSLTEIGLEAGNTYYKTVDGILYSADGSLLHTFPCGKAIADFQIPDGVTEVFSHGMEAIDSLESLTIPASVTALDWAAFGDCVNLTEIHFLGSAPTFDEYVFSDVTATAYYPGGDDSWTDDVMQDYDGDITWVPVAAAPAPALKLAGMSTKGAALSWSAIADASSYELQGRTGEGSWALLDKSGSTAFTHSAVKMGETYGYRVRALAGGAWTAWSEELRVFFNPFKDVSGTKTIEYVAWAYNNEIVKGTSETTFKPDAGCTRIQFVMMLWKMNGSPEVSGKNPFSDISGSKTTKAILWALEAGVINSGKTFDPDGNITRVQIVMILWKLAGSPEVTGTNPFKDVSGTKTTKAVLWAYQNGITKGTSATTFAPDKDCTRVQLVVFLYKYNQLASAGVHYRALLVGEVHFSWETAQRNQGDVNLISEMLANAEGPEGGKYEVTAKLDLSTEGIRKAIAETFADADDDDVSLFFIGTHGVTNIASGPYAGELVTIERAGVTDGYLTLGDLASWLKAVPGKVIVVLGSCGSGAAIVNNGKLCFVADSSGEADAVFSDAVIRAFAEADTVSNTGEFRDGKFYVLTAAAHQESSWGYEGPYSYYNIFPYYFAKGANTGKPADANKDGVITLQEMFNYTYTQSLNEVDQHAQVYPTNSSYPLFK